MLHFFVPFLSLQFPQCSVKAKTEKNLETEHWSLLVLVEIAFPLWHAVKVWETPLSLSCSVKTASSFTGLLWHCLWICSPTTPVWNENRSIQTHSSHTTQKHHRHRCKQYHLACIACILFISSILNVCFYHWILNSIWFNQPPHILNSDLCSSILQYIGFERTNCLIKPGSMRITGQQSQFHSEFETSEICSKQIRTILHLYNSSGLYFLWFCHFYTISGEFQLIQAKMATMHATLSACRSLAIFNTAHKNIS